ncbi:hypothetical protein vseg_021391 [Gypsophila vaccaria]
MSSKTTNYGTIPTAPTPPPPSFVTRPTVNRRPWREFLSPHTLSVPTTYGGATARIRRNINYFRYNYALTTLVIVFTSLIFSPLSMITFLLVFALWVPLFFSRDAPLVVLGRPLDDRVVLVFLFFVTVLALVATGVGANVLIALSVAVGVVFLHAAFRGVDDLFLDDVGDDGDGDGDGNGLVDVVQGQPLRPTYARVV